MFKELWYKKRVEVVTGGGQIVYRLGIPDRNGFRTITMNGHPFKSGRGRVLGIKDQTGKAEAIFRIPERRDEMVLEIVRCKARFVTTQIVSITIQD